MSVCVSEKSNLKEKKKKEKRKRKKTMPNYVWWIYTQNYVFKITFQIPSNVKMGYIYIYIYSIIELKYIKKRETEKWIHHFLEPNKALL